MSAHSHPVTFHPEPQRPKLGVGLGYTVSLEFEAISLPPFKDILVLAKKCPVGMIGISKCLGLIAPDGFELHEVDDPVSRGDLDQQADHQTPAVVNRARHPACPSLSLHLAGGVDEHRFSCAFASRPH
ncbi:MAG: hypothetical protein HQL97_16535 [Magnetococcales bacterium]|nr:hypothetical protein [Magnetococcales bacterium]